MKNTTPEILLSLVSNVFSTLLILPFLSKGAMVYINLEKIPNVSNIDFVEYELLCGSIKN